MTERQGPEDRRKVQRGGRRKIDKVRCPHCLYSQSSVVPRKLCQEFADRGGYMRTRRCDACRQEFLTVERPLKPDS